MTRFICALVVAGLVPCLFAPRAAAQEMEPRAYAPSPVGATFYIAGIGKSEGGILLDPSLDVDNVQADFWFATVGAGHTFDLLGQQARILVVVPYVDGEVTGNVGAAPRQGDLSGLADPRIKFSIGLFGSSALTLDEFARGKQETAIGASLTVVPPLGAHENDQPVNVGFNRWAFKPEIGVSHAMGQWSFEASAGVWLFTDNDDYSSAHLRREQDPVTATQAHVGYTFEDGSWLAVNAVWFEGGQTTTGGIEDSNRQNNVRLGVTYSLPLGDGQSLKFAYGSGISTRRGSDFDTVNVTWQLVEF